MTYSLKDPDCVIIDGRKRSILERAISAGASQALIAHSPFRISTNTINIEVAGKTRVNIISKSQQLASYKELWEDPYSNPYTFVISSSPTEVMAQMVAMRLFLRAMDHTAGKMSPVWHRVYGGIGHDKLRDEETNMSIPLLVLSNVPVNSTPYKVEKLRDIVAKYGHIPKIIVTSDSDPIEFTNTHLKMPVHYAMYLGNKKPTVRY